MQAGERVVGQNRGALRRTVKIRGKEVGINGCLKALCQLRDCQGGGDKRTTRKGRGTVKRHPGSVDWKTLLGSASCVPTQLVEHHCGEKNAFMVSPEITNAVRLSGRNETSTRTHEDEAFVSQTIPHPRHPRHATHLLVPEAGQRVVAIQPKPEGIAVSWQEKPKLRRAYVAHTTSFEDLAARIVRPGREDLYGHLAICMEGGQT